MKTNFNMRLLMMVLVVPLFMSVASALTSIEECPWAGADESFCDSIKVLNVSYPEANYRPGAVVPIYITIKNNDMLTSQVAYVEGYVAPDNKVGYAMFDLFAIVKQADACCPGNEFYDAKIVALSPGETKTLTVYPKVPTPESIDTCSNWEDTSAWNGYGKGYVVGVSVLKNRESRGVIGEVAEVTDVEATCYPNPDRTVDYTWVSYWGINVTGTNIDTNTTNGTDTKVCDDATSGLTLSNIKADSYEVQPGDKVTVTATATVTKAGTYGIEAGMQVYNKFAIIEVAENSCGVELNFANKKQLFDVGTHSLSFELTATEEGYNKVWVNKFASCGDQGCGKLVDSTLITVGEPPLVINDMVIPLILMGVGLVVVGLGYNYSKGGKKLW